MEFSSNPLNGKLLEKQKSSAEKENKEKSSDKIDYPDAARRGVGLTPVNERVPADPYRQRPCEDGYVSAIAQSKISQNRRRWKYTCAGRTSSRCIVCCQQQRHPGCL